MAKHTDGEIKIEKGVPILPHGNATIGKYPFGKMDVGDSIFAKNIRSARAALNSYRRKHHANRQFITRAIDGGVRIWRIA